MSYDFAINPFTTDRIPTGWYGTEFRDVESLSISDSHGGWEVTMRGGSTVFCDGYAFYHLAEALHAVEALCWTCEEGGRWVQCPVDQAKVDEWRARYSAGGFAAVEPDLPPLDACGLPSPWCDDTSPDELYRLLGNSALS